MTKNQSKVITVFSIFFTLTCFAMNDGDVIVDMADEAIREHVRNRQSAGAWTEFKTNAGKVAFVSAGTAATTYFMPGLGAAVGMGSVYMLKDHLSSLASYYGLYPADENMVLAQKLNGLEEAFELKRNMILDFNAKEGEATIRAAREEIGYGLKPAHDHVRQMVKNRHAKLELLLSFPTTYSKAPKIENAIKDIKKHLVTYSNDVADDVVSAVAEIHELSGVRERFQSNGDDEISTKTTFLFLGDAGVGKTETAEMIAKVLKRPFCKFSLASMTVADFFGASSTEAWMGKMGKIGAFARCFTNPDKGEKALDPIIFLDEIHDLLNSKTEDAIKFYSLIKNITDGKEMSVNDHGSDLKIDYSGATFILASNAEIEGDTAGALGTRMSKIDFSNLTSEQKAEIAKRTFDDDCHVLDYQPQLDDKEVIAAIATMDASPGARVLKKVIRKYVLYRKNHTIIKLRGEGFNITRMIKQNGGIVATK